MDARDELLSLSRWIYERWPGVKIYDQIPAAEVKRPLFEIKTVYSGYRPLTGAYYEDIHTHQIDYLPDESHDAVLDAHVMLSRIKHALLNARSIPGYLHDFTWFRPAVVKTDGGLPPGMHYIRVAGINALGQETLPSDPVPVRLTNAGGIRIYPTRFPPGNPLAVRHAIYYSESEAGPYRLVTELVDPRLRARPGIDLTNVPPLGRGPVQRGTPGDPNSIVFCRTIRIEEVETTVIEDRDMPNLPTGILRVRTCSLGFRTLQQAPVVIPPEEQLIPPRDDVDNPTTPVPIEEIVERIIDP